MTKLPPLPSKLDQEYEAVKETVELNFRKCTHKDAKIIDNELKCVCGAAWSGANLDHLQRLFKDH